MARVAGITVERTIRGRGRYVRIDLRKHSDLIPVLEQKGVEIDEPIKWTAKMKRSFAQAKNGEIYEVDLNNFWDV
jgi:TPP-dependent 2-oxoacid decarboxylase